MTDTLDRIELDGYINDEGKLEVEVPPGFPAGKVRVALEAEKIKNGNDSRVKDTDELPFTDEELKELMTFKYRNPQEVIAEGLLGGWEHLGIEDSVEWVAEQRRKRREHK